MQRFLDLGFSNLSAQMLGDAYETIASLNLWDTLRAYDPEPSKGFMFANEPFLTEILDRLVFEGHSGSSWSWTMRNMEAIAKQGWESYAARTRVALEDSGPPYTSAKESVRVFQATQPVCTCRRARGLVGWCEATPNNIPRCEDSSYPPPSPGDGLAFLRMGNVNQPPCPCRVAKGYTWGWCGVAGGGVPGCEH